MIKTASRTSGAVQRFLIKIVVVSTVAVFVTGILLTFAGPAHRDPLLLLHKVSFIVWAGFTALHVLGHLLELPHSLRASGSELAGSTGAGAAGRWIAIAGALAGGLVLALSLISQFGPWTS